jgi:hypothetical protein
LYVALTVEKPAGVSGPLTGIRHGAGEAAEQKVDLCHV